VHNFAKYRFQNAGQKRVLSGTRQELVSDPAGIRIAAPRLTSAAGEDHRPLRLLRSPEKPEPRIEQELTYLSTNLNREGMRGKGFRDFLTECQHIENVETENSNQLTREVNVGRFEHQLLITFVLYQHVRGIFTGQKAQNTSPLAMAVFLGWKMVPPKGEARRSGGIWVIRAKPRFVLAFSRGRYDRQLVSRKHSIVNGGKQRI
jgi:hypothetical protein